MLNEREIKHVKQLKTFKTMDEFKESRPFSRVATALLIEDVLNLAPDNEELIYVAFPKYEELKQKLENYRNVQTSYQMSNNIKTIILNEAIITNNWDENIHSDIVKFREIMKQFGFVKYLTVENRKFNEDDKAIIKNLIYTLLKSKKITGTDYDELELVQKIPDEYWNQLCVDEEGQIDDCECNLLELEKINQIENK